MFWGLILYGFVMAAAGVAFSRSLDNREDYFFASGKMGSSAVAVSLTASWFGAASFLITLQEAGKNGLRAMWVIAVPAVVTLAVIWFFARKVKEEGFLSLPQLYEAKFSKGVREISSLFLFLYLILLSASQLVAVSTVFEPVLELNRWEAVILACFLVLLYSSSGGFKAVVFTDIIQLLFIFSAVIYLFIVNHNRITLNSIGWEKFFSNPGKDLLVTLSFVIAWSLSPIAWQRIDASRSVSVARRAIIISATVLFCLYFSIVLIGANQPVVNFAHPLIFFGLLSSILSTLDSGINSAGMIFAFDIVKKSSALFNVLSSIMALALSAVIALRFKSILSILGASSEVFSEVLFPPFLVALVARRRLPWTGTLGMVAGGVFLLYNYLIQEIQPWPYSLPIGILVNGGGLGLGYLFDRLSRKGVN